MTTDQFVLITERFTLNPLTQSDAPLLAELGSDPDVVKPLICDWSTPSKRMKIAKYWIEGSQEYGIWGVLDRQGVFGESGQMIGFCAADEPLPLGGKGPEIYYAFSRETWGHGVGTEVVRVVIDHLFEELGVSAVEAVVLAGLNPASGRLLAKLGMSFIGNYPLADYIGEECDPTIEYELWRVKNSPAENARMNLEEAAFKIGQFVGEDMASEETMSASLMKAATENSHLASENEETLTRLIKNSLLAGMAEKGWLHYRIEKS
jgi:RimJ/RimL family protein N-acetyltransferase